MSRAWHAAVDVVVAATYPPSQRERYREQGHADIDGARELGLSRMSILRGLARASEPVTTPQERRAMNTPIGPLAIAMRHRGTPRHRVLILVGVFGFAALFGIGLLLA